MTFPTVIECTKAAQPADRDPFIAAAERERVPPAWPLPRRRPADA